MRKILKIRDVVLVTGMCKTLVYRKMKEGDFPKPVRLSERSVGWREEDVDEWIRTRPSVCVGV